MARYKKDVCSRCGATYWMDDLIGGERVLCSSCGHIDNIEKCNCGGYVVVRKEKEIPI